MADCNVFILTQLGNGWRVQQFNEGGVWPSTEYDSARLMLARLAQLLETGPIAPQLHAEKVQIG